MFATLALDGDVMEALAFVHHIATGRRSRDGTAIGTRHRPCGAISSDLGGRALAQVETMCEPATSQVQAAKAIP